MRGHSQHASETLWGFKNLPYGLDMFGNVRQRLPTNAGNEHQKTQNNNKLNYAYSKGFYKWCEAPESSQYDIITSCTELSNVSRAVVSVSLSITGSEAIM